MTKELLQQALNEAKADAIEVFTYKDGIARSARDAIEYMHSWLGVYFEKQALAQQEHPASVDAYVGAREDAAIWKKRALEAEELNRKFIAELNGPTYLGEPAQPAQKPDLWKTQFLTDVMTSAGLLRYGRTDKKLAQRIADGSARWRTELYTRPAPTQPALSESEIRSFGATNNSVFDSDYLEIYFGVRRKVPDLATRAIRIFDDFAWERGDATYRRATHYGLMREFRAIEAHCRGGAKHG